MLTEIISYIDNNWIPWLFALIGVVLGYIIRKLKEQSKQNNAIADGVQSLLRESIVSNYNKYLDKGHCPIYAKESLKKAYHAYHDLGGNDIATELYTKTLKMPEEPAKKGR